ncbi:MAG: endonuclease/exonuclease/phosphatase family protein [Pseudomonadaceae bacterium]|nr:endonuclease/exonuclease/phosphatase family protein [Pseudomonadaceae bacterium]
MMSWARRAERSCVVDAVANQPLAQQLQSEPLSTAAVAPLKLLSFNIQVGIKTSAYRQYFTKGWKHVLPHVSRGKNLSRIADLVTGYDLVGLQEIDGGSIRSGFVNQVEYLSRVAGFPYWYAQLNRDLGPIAQHGNGLLSRIEPVGLEDHKLPGFIPGRGAVFLRLPYAGDEIVVVMLHLSLGKQSRDRQLAYVAEQVAHERQVIIMGDMNTPVSTLLEDSPLKRLNLQPAETVGPTYPAWQPSLALDHVLVSDNLVIKDYQVLNCRVSDHLPIAVEVAAKARPLVQ